MLLIVTALVLLLSCVSLALALAATPPVGFACIKLTQMDLFVPKLGNS